MDVGEGGGHNHTTFNRIMLKFRPIAPKPPADGSVSDSMSASSSCKTPPPAKRRTKRKYDRVNNNNNKRIGKCKSKSKTPEDDQKRDLQFHDTLVSLQAPSSTITGTTVSPDTGSSKYNMSFGLPILMNLDKVESNDDFGLSLPDQSDPAAAAAAAKVMESWVVVNGMAETLLDVLELGSTDREKMQNLEKDTCPGLISDGLYRVQWVNLAYKRMVDPRRDLGEPPAQVVVRLVLKENMPVVWPMFACTVRVVYTWRNKKYSQTMPCDVWKMEFGGFAWRLDAKAALCLAR